MCKTLLFTVCFLFLLGHVGARGNDSLLMAQLVSDIKALQQPERGKDFYAGMFPSFRECGGSPHNYQPDNNIFYTAVSVFALKNMLPHLPEAQQTEVGDIIAKAAPVFPLYRNKRGYPYYSFWATNDVIMPHTFLFQYLKSVFGQGEDADDSVMSLMATENNSTDNAVLKQQLIATSNLRGKKIISTFPKYRKIPAYSTWLGQRMPVDFDFGVHCNILYFMFEKKLPLVAQDSATIRLLQHMVASRQYLTAPVYISPYYVRSSILLYHLARLMGKFYIPELESYKPQVIADIQDLIRTAPNVMDQIILRTSLLRLGAGAPSLPSFSIQAFEKSNQQSFVFFQARAAFSYPTPFKQIFLHWSYIYYYFYCPAYNKILWLEYLAEKNKHT